jgi:nucleolar protein 56
MKIFVAEHALGSFAFDEEGKLIAYSLNPKDVGKVVEMLLMEEEGEPLASTVDLLKKVNADEVVVENEVVIPKIQAMGIKASASPHHLGARKLRANLTQIAKESNFSESESEIYNFLHVVSLELTRRKLRRAAQKRDQLAIQAVRAIDDIDKTINLFSERLREWYSLHFPELDKMIEDHRVYASIVAQGYRDLIGEEDLKKLGIQEQRARKIVEVAKRSMGADLSDDDIFALTSFASNILSLFTVRDQLTDYVESVMKEIAPNVTALVGASLGARLLSLAGSLEELAKMPASTIQVLGAEKALFRALRSGSRPPKHGVIFQYPVIHNSPRWQRGKIARALASKLAIAAKIDAFSGRYEGDQLREQLNKRVEEIKEKYPSPPPKKEQERREPAKPKDKRKGGKRFRRRK